MSDKGILETVISAHGGLERWRQVNAIRTRVRGIFPLMMIKGVFPRWRTFDATINAGRPRVHLRDYPSAGCQGEFDRWRVAITTPDSRVEERDYMPRGNDGRPLFRYVWDDLDLLFFIGYALWNYMVSPFLFMQQGFEHRRLEPVRWRGQWLQRMDLVYPDDLPKHCKTQRYFIDERGLIRRLDYRADVIGSWAIGAHLCSRYESFDGLYYPCRREVYGGWIPRLVPRFPPAVIAEFQSIEPQLR